MRQYALDVTHPQGMVESCDLAAEGGDIEDLRRGFILFGLGYLGLVALAFYVDYKVQMRRARKRREAREKGPKR